ncbi:hypothetical protein CPC08DRAFT_715797 [Agrocybe pediades]|nr:hypothetical protein CPC08DRAFT_715797 [Agrocybe pediades]
MVINLHGRRKSHHPHLLHRITPLESPPVVLSLQQFTLIISTLHGLVVIVCLYPIECQLRGWKFDIQALSGVCYSTIVPIIHYDGLVMSFIA